MARKTYTCEFQLQADWMLTDQRLPVAEVARREDSKPWYYFATA